MPLRAVKAQEIEQLLGLGKDAIGKGKLLEVGTGSGGIAHYFAYPPVLRFEVHAVDANDNRQLCDGYSFQQVVDCALPFENASFDVVISNHVIEHVGARPEQLHNLSELRRVLKSGGGGYLAVPNRWMLVEPHFHVAFLSWLPQRWRSPYLKWRRGIAFYDCEPLTLPRIEKMLDAAGLRYQNNGVEALRVTLTLEHAIGSIPRLILDRVPDRLLHELRALIPTLI